MGDVERCAPRRSGLLAGTGFRTAQAIDELERRTGRTVIGADQALLRNVLTVTTAAELTFAP